jgi:hypothetical protein
VVQLSAGVSQLVLESFSGFFMTGSLCHRAAALKIGGHYDACDKGSGGCKKECNDSRKHGHLLF